MRLVSLAAEKIQRAAGDEDEEQKLFAAVESERRESDGGGRLLSDLVEYTTVVEEELEVLTPIEWQWFASWRQALGGGLDRLVLNYLIDCATTRFARYQVRALVLRDPATNEQALSSQERPEGVAESVGLTWLREQAQGARVTKMIGEQNVRIEQARAVEAQAEQRTDRENAIAEETAELASDALQCDTDASEFLIQELRAGEFGSVIDDLIDYLNAPTVTSTGDADRWYEAGVEPAGG
ncbi:hypothetical protein GCM10009641_18380 [Mycobacterium cookii]|uniref:Uncharacterized protein n=1 Tax=Mycobacterium cookii TaxID=1775 RepID=A0A7I7KZU2_9MYCO|nr:hypothetical protein [Mycobacterium cookii]MCV7330178.1 hypothetical protein [Mycobacterium cookii]BBX47640.1 hypothetical protein MCOO_36550 [Mycobacterium cookii]